MKKIFLIMGVMALSSRLPAQLKTTPVCPPLYVEILDGKVNDLTPVSTVGQIREKLPCFTGIQESTSRCGAGIFYKDRDIYFYTGRHYIEIGEHFKGKLSIPLLGAGRNNLFKWLGNPKIKDVNWDAFETAYGTLILYYSKSGKVNKIQFSTLSTEALNLCE